VQTKFDKRQNPSDDQGIHENARKEVTQTPQLGFHYLVIQMESVWGGTRIYGTSSDKANKEGQLP